MPIINVQGEETEQEAMARINGGKELTVVPEEEAPPAQPFWDDGSGLQEFDAEVKDRNARTAAERDAPPVGFEVGETMTMQGETLQCVEAGASAPESLGAAAASKSSKKKKKAVPEKSEEVRQLEAAATLETVALKDVVAAEQPRQFFDDDKLRELADSIKEHGLIQPPLLRRQEDGKYQVVTGERRVRACRLLGYEEIRAFIGAMSQDTILDAQVAENLHRADLTALEEAGAYERMTAPRETGGLGRTVDEVAERTCKSRAWVYGRLKLLSLCPEGQRLFQRGEMTASVSEAVARIDGHDQQARCLVELDGLRLYGQATKPEEREPVSYRAALELIRTKYMLDLSKAPFDKKDDLLTQAGSCTKCPSNSTNQPGDLFSVRSRPHCQKSDCYQEKCDAAWEKEVEKAEKRGHKALTRAKGRALYKHGALQHDAPYVELDGPCVDDTQRRTWRALLKDKRPQVFVCPDAEGKPHELVEREAALAAMSEAGLKFAKAAKARLEEEAKEDSGVAAPAASATKEAREKHEREQKVRQLVSAKLVAETVRRVEAKGLALADLRAIAEDLVGQGEWDTIADRRGVKGGYQAVMEEIRKAGEKKLFGWIMEGYIMIHGGMPGCAEVLAKLAGHDLEKLEAQVRASLEVGEKVEEAKSEKKQDAAPKEKKVAPKKEKAKKSKSK